MQPGQRGCRDGACCRWETAGDEDSTIPEFFEKYYDTKGRVISAVGLVIIMSVITALQYLGGRGDSGFAAA